MRHLELLDEVNERLLAVLGEDLRLSLAELARRVVSGPAVRKRVTGQVRPAGSCLGLGPGAGGPLGAGGGVLGLTVPVSAPSAARRLK